MVPSASFGAMLRVPAERFYHRLGWKTVSEVFEIPTAGPHVRMTRVWRTPRTTSGAFVADAAEAADLRLLPYSQGKDNTLTQTKTSHGKLPARRSELRRGCRQKLCRIDDVAAAHAAATVLLAALGARRALELAVGTGRIALPLAAAGIHVDGIDFSSAMIAILAGLPGRLFPDEGHPRQQCRRWVPGTYRLIYIVFNTLFNLLTQDEQVRCFQNVAAHLELQRVCSWS